MATGDLFFGGPLHDFEHIGGVHLAGSVLWFDASRKNGLNFLSSAGAGEIGKNRRFLCTEATARLASRGRGKLDVLTAPYGSPLTVGELRMTLHPAGHLLGSAQLEVERNGRRVIYAGDVSTRPSATTLRAEARPCSALALPATYGAPGFSFPPREEVLEGIQSFIESCLADKKVPVLLAPPMGIAQELLVSLGRLDVKLKVHKSIADVAKMYAELGLTLPPYKRLTKAVSRGEVLIMPPILRTSVDGLIADARVALVGPRSVDAAHVHQLRVMEAFPLSNVADRAELSAFILETGAEDVFLTGGAVSEFAYGLRDAGIRVHELLPREQLELFSEL